MTKSNISGFLLINKPRDWTSFDVVAKLRSITGIKKIGHAGTLDPFATGLLIVAIGRNATKHIDKFVKLDKEYIATLMLGADSDTYDRDGVITQNKNAQDPGIDKIRSVIKNFAGPQEQIPPMFSAKKINGQKLYKLARQGKTIKRKTVNINVYEAKIIDYKWPQLIIRFKVSSGTYIRSLARDIGRKIKTGAYLKKLNRTQIADYRIENSCKLDTLDRESWSDRLFLPTKND